MMEPLVIEEWVDLGGLAAWFGCSKPTMRRKLPGLYEQGFPRPCKVIGKWYLPRCRKWAGGKGSEAVGGDELMRALDGQRVH